jgi:hypothetical protein
VGEGSCLIVVSESGDLKEKEMCATVVIKKLSCYLRRRRQYVDINRYGGSWCPLAQIALQI